MVLRWIELSEQDVQLLAVNYVSVVRLADDRRNSPIPNAVRHLQNHFLDHNLISVWVSVAPALYRPDKRGTRLAGLSPPIRRAVRMLAAWSLAVLTGF